MAAPEGPHIVDLFAGPGGWDLAAERLGLRPIGIEWDHAACATRRHAGLRTLQADVAALDPLGFGEVVGLIASPPCQAFSMAGKGQGRRDVEAIERVAHDLAAGRDTRQEAGAALGEAPEGALFGFEIGDARALLVVEPLRWALALRPRWIAFEQVAPVLPLWGLFAGFLRNEGYATWTGVLSAEQYGVPQTRKRAILLASLDGPVGAPPATHTLYAKGKPRQADGLLPWVSMCDALGWGMTERPSVSVAAKAGQTGGNRGLASGSGAERAIAAERARGAWGPNDRVGFPRLNDRVDDDAPRVADPDGKYRARDLRRGDEPAFVLTEKARSWQRWIVDTGNTRGGTRTEGRSRSTEEPGPTVTSRADQLEWRDDEPDTQRVVRVTVEEASVLQTFPADYPWQGTRSDQFMQVGNAVPPLLAEAALRTVAVPAEGQVAA